ncbi:hypothetical protein [Cellulomonas pakistanensis]|uniref:Uncharacterized protein n=1 Tax=Cellulomonas pakistanensis TaxID=992287 RepID=A0A919PBQ4_9CELL|nr:hypothetical protein [Cellulomonas pakistanensis]GIG36736.1 hypothetical protein Cpa01nite_21170 [Cellulomonas pakistanensis]
MLLTAVTTAGDVPGDGPVAFRVVMGLVLAVTLASQGWVVSRALRGDTEALRRVQSQPQMAMLFSGDVAVLARAVVPASALTAWSCLGVAGIVLLFPSGPPGPFTAVWLLGIVVLSVVFLVAVATGRPAVLISPPFRGRSKDEIRAWFAADDRARARDAALRQQVARARARGLPAGDAGYVGALLRTRGEEAALRTLCELLAEQDVALDPSDRAVLESLGTEVDVPVSELLGTRVERP